MIFQKKKTVFEINKLSTRVVSEKMGCDRGTPIDRYYIEKFLEENSQYITGNVMEIGDNSYTLKYGKNVENSFILTQDIGRGISNAIVGDLATGEGCEDELLDCFILTQTLPFIYDVNSAAQNVVKMLKKGGTALVTVRGISMISQYDNSRWGDYWGFTETSLRRLFSKYVDENNITVQTHGNPKVAAAFLYGMSQEDIQEKDLYDDDSLCPVIITAKVTK